MALFEGLCQPLSAPFSSWENEAFLLCRFPQGTSEPSERNEGLTAARAELPPGAGGLCSLQPRLSSTAASGAGTERRSPSLGRAVPPRRVERPTLPALKRIYKTCKSPTASATAPRGLSGCFCSPTALNQQTLMLETRQKNSNCYY